ncbi:MAG TPA: hemerythrin domain-containing protein [Trebonia sp.]|nr:hemerythrin domain-containing protein [Trebonia sp.]
MTEVGVTQRRRQDGLTPQPPPTLGEEHVLLLWQVAARAGEVLTAAAAGRWPGAELAALAGYARAEVLRQAADEEALLFPAVPSQQATGLARDHVRLRSATELLERVADGEQPLSPAQLTAAIRDFLVQFERHLRREEELLAPGRPPRGAPGTVKLGGHRHEWYPLTEGPVVDLDALSPGHAVAAAVDRLLRMHRGEQVELLSSAPLKPVWREISTLSPDGYLFTVVRDGPPQWRMNVTRRQPGD